jgi:hypothetical protein
MKKASILLIALSSLLMLSCREEEEKPKVIYEGTKSSENAPAPKDDATNIKVADLPVLMEGTKYLIHPIGELRVYENRSSKVYGSSRANDDISYAISNYSQFEITGYFENLKFQHVDSTAIYPLTDKLVQIQTATLLQANTPKIKKQLLVYTLVDADTNKDGKVDANDIRSLYLSDSSGKNFKKISVDMQELVDWSVIDAQGKLYFRTIEDINKNGAFDKNDAVHYHYADLLTPEWTVTEYQPIAK